MVLQGEGLLRTRYFDSAVCACTFGDGVKVGFLAHGGQQGQSADVNPHLGVAVVLPGVILDHVEQTSD